MKNKEYFKETLEGIDRIIDESRREAESWRAVGKNYCCRKDGKPYSSIKKAMYGVVGIDSCYTVKRYGESETFLKNEEGFVIVVTGLSLSQVEEKIAETIALSEERMNVHQHIREKYIESIEKCDKMLELYSEITQDTGLESPFDYSLRVRIDGYLKDSADKMNAKLL